MIDIFGAVVTLIRADSAVAAITTRVSSEVLATPCVQLIDNATTERPFGPGSGRMGRQLWVGIARCWAEDSPTGAIAARQLAGTVSDVIHNHGPVKVGTRAIDRMYVTSIAGLARDPATRRPFYDVLINAYAATYAV